MENGFGLHEMGIGMGSGVGFGVEVILGWFYALEDVYILVDYERDTSSRYWYMGLGYGTEMHSGYDSWMRCGFWIRGCSVIVGVLDVMTIFNHCFFINLHQTYKSCPQENPLFFHLPTPAPFPSPPSATPSYRSVVFLNLFELLVF